MSLIWISISFYYTFEAQSPNSFIRRLWLWVDHTHNSHATLKEKHRLCHEDMEVQSYISVVDANDVSFLQIILMGSDFTSTVCNLWLVGNEGLIRLCCVVIYSRLCSVSHSYAGFRNTAPAPSCEPGCSGTVPWMSFKEAGGSFPVGLALVSSATALFIYQVCR